MPPKKVEFSKENVCFDLEMMGFLILFPSTRMVIPHSEGQGAISQKWHSLYMGRGAPMLPTHGQGGALPFMNAPKKVEFSKENVCFDLEMMGFLLPYDLGVMNSYFNGVKGW
jgi:hypothetical protein